MLRPRLAPRADSSGAATRLAAGRWRRWRDAGEAGRRSAPSGPAAASRCRDLRLCACAPLHRRNRWCPLCQPRFDLRSQLRVWLEGLEPARMPRERARPSGDHPPRDCAVVVRPHRRSAEQRRQQQQLRCDWADELRRGAVDADARWDGQRGREMRRRPRHRWRAHRGGLLNREPLYGGYKSDERRSVSGDQVHLRQGWRGYSRRAREGSESAMSAHVARWDTKPLALAPPLSPRVRETRRGWALLLQQGRREPQGLHLGAPSRADEQRRVWGAQSRTLSPWTGPDPQQRRPRLGASRLRYSRRAPLWRRRWRGRILRISSRC